MPERPRLLMSLVRAEESRYVHRVLADGEPTGITISTVVRRPGHTVASKELSCGDETFDALAGGMEAALEWIHERLERKEGARV